MTFDRAEFEVQKARMLAEQAKDRDLFTLGRGFIVKSDQHGYAYQWKWCGLPIIQMPQDVVAVQQIMWQCRPSVVVETGVAWGGSIALYASLMDLYGGRLVVGIDLNLVESVEQAIADLQFQTPIELMRASSTEPTTVESVHGMIRSDDTVMVILDSNHTHDHVLQELRDYSGLVTPGQYLVVSDTIVEDIPVQTHRPRPWGPGDNPGTAAAQFLVESPAFTVDYNLHNQLVMSFNPRGYLVRG